MTASLPERPPGRVHWPCGKSIESPLVCVPHLDERGYRVGLAGKVHVKPAVAFPFENVSGFDPNCVRNPTRNHQLDGIRSFMQRDAKKPFCLVVALVFVCFVFVVCVVLVSVFGFVFFVVLSS